MSTIDRRDLHLHLVVEVDGARSAHEEALQVLATLTTITHVRRWEVKLYPKLPNTWSLRFHLDPVPSESAVFDAIVAQEHKGWTRGEALPGEDRWAVWNPVNGRSLLTPHVRWAHLETYPPTGG